MGGGSTMAAATRLDQLLNYDKDLYLYDTFEGMVKPTEKDSSNITIDPSITFENLKKNDNSSDWCYASLDEVIKNIKNKLSI